MQREGWTMVKSKRTGFRWDVFPFGGRNGGSVKLPVTSFYVSEFPKFCNAKRLFELFGCSGNVVEVAISPRRNRHGKRFAFARFLEVEDGRVLAFRLDNILIEGKKIHVNLPRFSRVQGVKDRRNVPLPSKGLGNRFYAGSDSGVYKGKAKGSFRGFSGSYAEAVGYKGQDLVSKKEVVPELIFHSNQDLKSRFEKAYVGKVCVPGTAYNVQNYLEMEGIFNIKATPLGGNRCLLEEYEEGFIGDLIKEGETWWKGWFSEIAKWEAGMVDGRRDAWFRIYGIPIHVWSPEFFRFLGEKWGRFICTDDNTVKGEAFDVARILINIPLSLSLPDRMNICIDGAYHYICIREDPMNLYQNVVGNKKTASSAGESSESDDEILMLESDLVCLEDSVGLEDKKMRNSAFTNQNGSDIPSIPCSTNTGDVSVTGIRGDVDGLFGALLEGQGRVYSNSNIRSCSDADHSVEEDISKVPLSAAGNVIKSDNHVLEKGKGEASPINTELAGSDFHYVPVMKSKQDSILNSVASASKALVHRKAVDAIRLLSRDESVTVGHNPICLLTGSSPVCAYQSEGTGRGGDIFVNSSRKGKSSSHSGCHCGSAVAYERGTSGVLRPDIADTALLNSKDGNETIQKLDAVNSFGNSGVERKKIKKVLINCGECLNGKED